MLQINDFSLVFNFTINIFGFPLLCVRVRLDNLVEHEIFTKFNSIIWWKRSIEEKKNIRSTEDCALRFFTFSSFVFRKLKIAYASVMCRNANMLQSTKGASVWRLQRIFNIYNVTAEEAKKIFKQCWKFSVVCSAPKSLDSSFFRAL